MAMATKHSLLLLGILIFFKSLSALTKPAMADDIPADFSRRYFGDKFIFGTATSAYQIEGEANKSGRGPSVWDIFAHESPDRILDGSNGDVAVDFYHRFREDILNVKNMGFKAFRMSISWPRVIPSGRRREGINEQGIQFYSNVIDTIIANGLEPFVTIFHWDTPQALEDKYGGFLNRSIVDDYRDYADLLFERFGGRVKFWMTFNEPWALSGFAYDDGVFAPGRCSAWVNRKCNAGNSSTEPYIVAHHLLLAHAAAVQVYREKYQTADGKIGITLFTFWFEPLSDRPIDIEASKTALDFMFGLWMEPLTRGQYPDSVKQLVGDRLLSFNATESALLTKSYDFIGLQYYTAYYANPNIVIDPNFIRYKTDSHVNVTPYDYDGKLIGPQAYSPWFYIFPKGIRSLLKYTKDTYDDPEIYVTENGVDNGNNETQPIEEAVQDQFRVDYYRNHTWNVLKAIEEDKVNVKGYFAWSYLDNFEWNIGYTSRFGLYYVDYTNNLTRTAKDSALWFCRFLNYTNPEQCRKLRPENINQVTLNKIIEVASRKLRKLGKFYI